MKIKGQRFYKPYNNSTWIEVECPMIEVHPGVKCGSMMLKKLGQPKCLWMMTDMVYFDHLKTGFLVKI